MAEQFWGVGWLNENEQRAYPLLGGTPRVDVTGTFTLPDSFLVELYLPVHAGLAVTSSQFFLSRITSLPSGFAVAISYDDGTLSPPIVATAVMARAACVEFAAFALAGVGDFADCVGRVVIGLTNAVDLEPGGEFQFTPDSGRLDPDCVRPVPRGVASIAVAAGADLSPRFYGDIEFVAGTNIALTPTSNGVRIDAITGAGLTADCGCNGAQTLPPAIRTINGVAADANGAITLTGDSCIAIAPVTAGFQLNDRCSSPCCGSTELNVLETELEHFGAEAAALQSFVTGLASAANQFGAVVLGSRLNDSACTTG